MRYKYKELTKDDKEIILMTLYKLSHIRLNKENLKTLNRYTGICYYLKDHLPHHLKGKVTIIVGEPAEKKKWKDHSGSYFFPVPYLGSPLDPLPKSTWREGEHAQKRWELVDFLIHHYQNELRLTLWGRIKNWLMGL